MAGDRFQVSGLGHQVPGPGIQVQVQVREICHLSSVIDAVIDSALNAVLYSVLALSLPSRHPLTAIRFYLLHLLAFPAPTPFLTPFP